MAATPGNSINEAAASGLVNFDGTSVFSSTPLTQYNVLTGATANTVNNVAPSATSGIPLISQGLSAQPIFGTAVVTGGGTGDTSFTAYMPIAGGTTTAGALQSIATGTQYYELAYNTSSSLPSFQNNSVNSAYANTVVNLIDDFVSVPTTSATTVGSLGWVGNLSTASWQQAPAGTHPGMLILLLGNSSSASASINLGYAGGFVIGASGTLTATFYIKLSALSTSLQRYNCTFGLLNASDFNTATPANASIWFQYSDNLNSGDWTLNADTGGSTTTVNSTVAATTNYTVFQIIVNSTQINFLTGSSLANLASAGTITIADFDTTSLVSPAIGIYKSVGTTGVNVGIDLFTLNYQLASAR
jgi:hypothetical protein